MAEGIPTSVAYNEWTSMVSDGLDVQQSTVVHGTALGFDDFEHMAANDMKLVWSPRSNVFLYDTTTRIDLAITTSEPLTIALAPDWSLGGSLNMLDELAFAFEYDQSEWGGVLSPEDLVEMVTINAANALEIQDFLGSLEVGKLADLFILSGDTAHPYEALVNGRPGDVRLVMVDGKVLYGDGEIAGAASLDGCEDIDVCGHDRFLCVAEPSTDYKLDQTFAEILSIIQTALSDYDLANSTNFYPVAPLATCP